MSDFAALIDAVVNATTDDEIAEADAALSLAFYERTGFPAFLVWPDGTFRAILTSAEAEDARTQLIAALEAEYTDEQKVGASELGLGMMLGGRPSFGEDEQGSYIELDFSNGDSVEFVIDADTVIVA